jgi:hypothetical protein
MRLNLDFDPWLHNQKQGMLVLCLLKYEKSQGEKAARWFIGWSLFCF